MFFQVRVQMHRRLGQMVVRNLGKEQVMHQMSIGDVVR